MRANSCHYRVFVGLWCRLLPFVWNRRILVKVRKEIDLECMLLIQAITISALDCFHSFAWILVLKEHVPKRTSNGRHGLSMLSTYAFSFIRNANISTHCENNYKPFCFAIFHGNMFGLDASELCEHFTQHILEFLQTFRTNFRYVIDHNHTVDSITFCRSLP